MKLPNTNNFTVQDTLRLLLVEDNELLAEATADFLRGTGLEVLIADSGREALMLSVEFRPKIVLCDLNLPDMSGIEIARALRKNPATKNVLFVLHTALMETEFEGTRVPDVDLFLSKPIDPEKLAKILNLKRHAFKDGGSGEGVS